MKALLWRHSFAIAATALVLMLVALTTILLVRVLSLPLTGKTAVPALVAAITLPGVIATAVVSLIGYLLKQSKTCVLPAWENGQQRPRAWSNNAYAWRVPCRL